MFYFILENIVALLKKSMHSSVLAIGYESLYNETIFLFSVIDAEMRCAVFFYASSMGITQSFWAGSVTTFANVS